MIKLDSIAKTFYGEGGKVEAVKDVSLEIDDGEIFGIIGLSGAGKSTLVRCINLLERPDCGTVTVDNVELTSLDEKKLRHQRISMGMIFQHFNLMPSRTVWSNIAYPLKKQKLSKEQIDARVTELLELVDLSDKKDAYPNQLSGGQKQRVAIARAIASGPRVLLCDEATSALDPATTLSILGLLKKINKTLGLTIVIITHEMAVVKEICDRVAVMEGGRVVEEGDVLNIFSSPKSSVTKSFIESAANTGKILTLMEEQSPAVALEPGQVLARLRYHGRSADRAIISWISREYDIDCNIIFGNIEIIKDSAIGTLVLIFSGKKENIEGAVSYLSSNDVSVEVINR